MRIGIDARTIYMPVMKGIGVYLYHLLYQLARMDPDNDYILYYDPRQETVSRIAEIIPQQAKNFKEKAIQIPAGDTLHFWELFRLPAELKRDRIDLLHSPANTTCPGFCGKKIVTIHDTTIQELQNKSRKNQIYYNLVQPGILRKADVIITVSDFSKKSITNILRIDPGNIRVISQGVDPAFAKINDSILLNAVKEKHGFRGNYLLNAGGESAFKNVGRLIDAYAILARRHGIKENLVITGIRKKAILQAHLEHASRLNLSERVHILDFIPTTDLIALHSGAVLFVYPSLREGFGFPPLEAMACGTPVVASNAASIPEVVGRAALLFDPVNPEDMAEKIRTVLRDRALRAGLIKSGYEQVKKYRWENTARATLKVYQERVH